ncbi:MAG: ComEA family DNA-binding protein [Gammaproteobacteria bacterium]
MKTVIQGLVICLFPLLVQAGPVNVNTADAEELSRELNGIGLSKAQAIVDYRKEYGRFESPEELVKVKGIGARVIAANAGNILLED